MLELPNVDFDAGSLLEHPVAYLPIYPAFRLIVDDGGKFLVAISAAAPDEGILVRVATLSDSEIRWIGELEVPWRIEMADHRLPHRLEAKQVGEELVISAVYDEIAFLQKIPLKSLGVNK